MNTSEEARALATLVGKTVASTLYTDTDECCFTLGFTDKTSVHFSAIGDDMTHVTMSIEPLWTFDSTLDNLS